MTLVAAVVALRIAGRSDRASLYVSTRLAGNSFEIVVTNLTVRTIHVRDVEIQIGRLFPTTVDDENIGLHFSGASYLPVDLIGGRDVSFATPLGNDVSYLPGRLRQARSRRPLDRRLFVSVEMGDRRRIRRAIPRAVATELLERGAVIP